MRKITNRHFLYPFVFVFLSLIFSALMMHAQIYYTENGTNLPNPKPDTIYFKKGIFKGYDAEYGTLLVKENRKKNNARLIDIPIVKVPALHDNNNPPVFLLNGGPGISNIWEEHFPVFLLDSFSIVMIGYRGVDGSVKLDAPAFKQHLYNESEPLQLNHDAQLQSAWKTDIQNAQKDADLEGYTVAEVCYDIEIVREKLGYPKIHIFAFSFGTMLAQLYQETFANKVDKNVFICARPTKSNNFNFSDTLVLQNTIDSLLLHTYKKTEKEIADFYHFLNTELHYVNNLDKSKFYISLLNNLYSLQAISNFIEITFDAMHGKNDELLHYQTELNKHYDKMACLECVVKRYSLSERINELAEHATFFGQLIAYSNKFWNSASWNIEPIELHDQIIECPTLMLQGKNDFLSPPELIDKELLPRLSNYEIILLNNAAHEDVIGSVKKYKKEIYNFLLH